MNPVGRPRKYNSHEEIDEIIEVFFQDCETRQMPPTMSGLAYALEIDRKTLLNYSKEEEFFPTVKRAKLRIEIAVEQGLMKGLNTVGCIFNLKNNFDWEDHSSVDENTKLTIHEDLSDDELDVKIKVLLNAASKPK